MSARSSGAGLGPVMCAVGARPHFMKMAAILRALADYRLAILYGVAEILRGRGKRGRVPLERS